MQGLHIVATPIGNLADITLRGLMALSSADLVLCEDTRQTGKLLKVYNINKTKISYHDHSDNQKRIRILNLLAEGKRIVLVSDAGLPLISDPGYKLVQDVIEAGFPVYCLPGANAALTAIVTSGLPTPAFLFLGFIPSKKKDRNSSLEKIRKSQATLIFYETAKRMPTLLLACKSILGNRKCCLSREITKRYEEHKRGTLEEVLKGIELTPLKGECVLVVEGCIDTNILPETEKNKDWKAELEAMVLEKKLPLKEAARNIAKTYHISRKLVYRYGLDKKID